MNRYELNAFLPDIKEVQESPFIIGGKELAFQSSVILNTGYCIGSGFSENARISRSIALSEAIERKAFFNIYKSDLKSDYLADVFPTTCGFAVGNDLQSAQNRAVAEAVERWLRSKWIDEKYYLYEVNILPSELNILEKYFTNFFEKVRVFIHTCEINVNGIVEVVNSVITVGLSAEGAFVGSKSVLNEKAPLLSALVESWRHLRLSTSSTQKDTEIKIIKYFARNKEAALTQISNANKNGLKNPELRLLKKVDIPIEGIYCFRALCHDFKGWHGDEIHRFVY